MTAGRRRLERFGARVSAAAFGSFIALTGLLPARVRYGYVHPLSRVLFRTRAKALAAIDFGDAPITRAASRGAAAPGAITCVLAGGVLEVGGIGAVVELLAAELPEHGVIPVIVCLDDGERAARLRAAGVDVHTVHDEASALRTLRQIRPDAMQLHGAPSFLIDAARTLAAPLVAVLHNTEIHYSRRRWRSLARLLASSRAIAVSESVRAFHVAHLPAVVHGRVHVIPNAAPRHPGPTHEQRRAARILLEQTIGARLGDEPLFACLARYDAQKNIAGTVASFVAGLRDDDRAHLVVAGEPSDWAEYRRADAIRRSSVHAERVHLLAASDGPTLLAAADAFLLNSFFEGWPVAATEAWAAGLPLVLSDVGGARELVARDPGRSVLLPNPCGDTVTDAVVERARRRSLRQRNASAIADAVHAVAALGHPGAGPMPDVDVGSVATMVERHAEILRAVAGAASTGTARDCEVRVTESARGESTA